MITNLFSVFDPSTSLNIPLNWLSSIIGLCCMPWIFWISTNRHYTLISLVSNKLHLEFKILLGSSISKGHTALFLGLFVFVVWNNLLGLLPYVFTATSHFSVTLTLALPLWVRFIIYGWLNNTKHILAHIVPLGTPRVLIPFIVLIETIRNLIRPGTLAVRLAANIVAGHLLLVLLGNQGPGINHSILSLLLFAQILLLLLEAAVAVIQSYVFTVLSVLYSREV